MNLQERADIIKEIFLKNYPKATTELNFKNLYELLVSVMLSAQCTDKRVNLITPSLFEAYPNIKSLSKANLTSVKMLINSCNLYNNKSVNLIKMAQIIMDEFDGTIPLTKKELMQLPGVGEKTANVVLIEHLGANLMAVDTHVFRVSHRLGLTQAKTPNQTTVDLTNLFKTDLNYLHQAMVLFGRYLCKAVKPECYRCFLYDLCDSQDKMDF